MSADLEKLRMATGLEKISFQSVSKKGNAKECSYYHKLHSFHMLARLCSKSFKIAFSSMWTKTYAFTYMIIWSLILIDAELIFIVTFLMSFYIQGIWDSETPTALHRVAQLARTELNFRHTSLWLWNMFNFYYNILIQRKKGFLWPYNILYKYKYQFSLLMKDKGNFAYWLSYRCHTQYGTCYLYYLLHSMSGLH